MQLLLGFSKGLMKNRPGWMWKHPTSPTSRSRPIWEVFLEPPPTMHDAEGVSAHALLGTSCAVSARKEVLTVAVPDLLPSASQRDRGWLQSASWGLSTENLQEAGSLCVKSNMWMACQRRMKRTPSASSPTYTTIDPLGSSDDMER